MEAGALFCVGIAGGGEVLGHHHLELATTEAEPR